MGTGEKFLNRTAMACAVSSRIDKWDLMKLQSFCKAKRFLMRLFEFLELKKKKKKKKKTCEDSLNNSSVKLYKRDTSFLLTKKHC
jgi:hypothetical protein